MLNITFTPAGLSDADTARTLVCDSNPTIDFDSQKVNIISPQDKRFHLKPETGLTDSVRLQLFGPPEESKHADLEVKMDSPEMVTNLPPARLSIFCFMDQTILPQSIRDTLAKALNNQSVEFGLFRPEHVAYNLAHFNEFNEHKVLPKTVFHPCCGADITTPLLLTDCELVEGVDLLPLSVEMLEGYRKDPDSVLDETVDTIRYGTESVREVIERKRERGFWIAPAMWESTREGLIIYELKSLGVDLQQVKISEEGSDTVIKFPWKHPVSGKETTRTLKFSEGGVNGGMVKRPGQVNFFYTKATMGIGVFDDESVTNMIKCLSDESIVLLGKSTPDEDAKLRDLISEKAKARGFKIEEIQVPELYYHLLHNSMNQSKVGKEYIEEKGHSTEYGWGLTCLKLTRS